MDENIFINKNEDVKRKTTFGCRKPKKYIYLKIFIWVKKIFNFIHNSNDNLLVLFNFVTSRLSLFLNIENALLEIRN